MYYGYCNDPNPTEKPATEYVSAGITQCSTLLNPEIFDFFSNNCIGQTECTINAASFVM